MAKIAIFSCRSTERNRKRFAELGFSGKQCLGLCLQKEVFIKNEDRQMVLASTSCRMGKMDNKIL